MGQLFVFELWPLLMFYHLFALVFGTAPLLFFQFRSSSTLQNTFSSTNSAPKKKVELKANFTFFLEYLNGYSSFWSFVLSHRVEVITHLATH